MSLQRSEIEEFVRNCLAKASEVAERIELSESRMIKAAQSPLMVSNDSRFSHLETFYGMRAWMTALSVDVRKSSLRAIDIGARSTYLTMHAYLPTMIELVDRTGGKVVGLRGDGLIAGFGVERIDGSSPAIDDAGMREAVRAAAKSAKGMIEAVEEVIEPQLKEAGIRSKHGPLMIGVGIDIGEVVITNIGRGDASEITAYGPPVNNACKLCSDNNGQIRLSFPAQDKYPKGTGGRTTFQRGNGFYTLNFPDDYCVLS